MKLANMLGDRFRETPADCQIISQIFMIRGGYMKQVANGIYSLNMPARRIVRKIENILREEMDAIDGQEVLFPVVMPADLWRESGRYDKIGSELARFKDRSGNDMVLGMTHEEASVHLCAMRVDKPEVREAADALYDKLQKAGVEVIYDDRAVSAGVMFSDADLLGVPVRVVVSPKTLARGAVEISARDKSFRQDAAVEYACEEIQGIVKDMLSRCSAD